MDWSGTRCLSAQLMQLRPGRIGLPGKGDRVQNPTALPIVPPVNMETPLLDLRTRNHGTQEGGHPRWRTVRSRVALELL